MHIYIEKHQQLRAKSHSELLKKSTRRLPPYRYRFRRRSSSRSTEPRSRDLSPIKGRLHTIPSTDISMFTLSRDPSKITMGLSSTPTGTTLYSSTTPRPKSSKSRCIIIRPTGAPRPSELTSALCPPPPSTAREGKWTEESLRLHGMVLVMVLHFLQRMKPNGLSLSPTLRPPPLQVLTGPSLPHFSSQSHDVVSLCVSVTDVFLSSFFFTGRTSLSLPSLEEDLLKVTGGGWVGGVGVSKFQVCAQVSPLSTHAHPQATLTAQVALGGIHLSVC